MLLLEKVSTCTPTDLESNVVWNDLSSTEISMSVVCVENDDVDKSTVWVVKSKEAEFGVAQNVW